MIVMNFGILLSNNMYPISLSICIYLCYITKHSPGYSVEGMLIFDAGLIA